MVNSEESVFKDVEFYKKNAEFIQKPSGYIIMGGEEVANTLQCCHCGMHWIVINGSGTIRGYCGKCRKVTCGNPKCNTCTPFETVLEFSEGTKNDYFDEIKDKIVKFGGI